MAQGANESTALGYNKMARDLFELRVVMSRAKEAIANRRMHDDGKASECLRELPRRSDVKISAAMTEIAGCGCFRKEQSVLRSVDSNPVELHPKKLAPEAERRHDGRCTASAPESFKKRGLYDILERAGVCHLMGCLASDQPEKRLVRTTPILPDSFHTKTTSRP
jgi:hypothetical protein